eukprot:6469387-Amphidinium_carterae.1
MTISHERATDPRRVARIEQDEDDDCDPEESPDTSDDEDDADESLVRHSVKRKFAALTFGPSLGYASKFELLQFVYDLHLWSDLGSKKNLNKNVPMRVMMKGSSFSPLYWKEVHFTLLDAVKQLGYPKVFFTIAPYEWSFPYHEALKDAMMKELKQRLNLPIHETLHIMHVMLQTVKGLVVGNTGDKSKWQSQMLKVYDEEGQPKQVHAFLRIEFQDGHRKPGTQTYHGSGRPHLHSLIFCDTGDIPQLELEEWMSATMPSDPALAACVSGSQLDREKKSGWPVHKEDSYYSVDDQKLYLHHRKSDRKRGLRAFNADIMEALKCHQDIQFADDKGALRAYVTKYVSKFSDSASDEWLNDFAHATSIATTVLMRYKPMEPEMALQLFGARYRQ